MFLCLTMFLGNINGQTLRVSLIDEFSGDDDTKSFCADTAIIYVDSACYMTLWTGLDNPESVQSFELVVTESQHQGGWFVHSGQCGIDKVIHVYLSSPTSDPFNPFDEPYVWKRYGDTITLGKPELTYVNFEWSTGETSTTIDVVDDGIYSVEVDDPCGPRTYSIEVRNNVEISLATCDLESNKNLVTWQTTPAQAQYVDHVIVKRDGLEVGTANYSDGFFLDAIGSDAASRTYTIIAVATDGTECPIVSYPKETIHMSYTLGMGNTIEMGWNTPTGYDLLGYSICEWNPNDGNLSVVDFVGASVTSYTCQSSQFDLGYIVVQGVEAGKTESRLLSNRSWETVGLGEQSSVAFKVYPNPSSGIFTVEGTGILRIANVLGQEIITKEIDGNTAIELPQGIYFVQMNGTVQKIVVE